MLRFALLALALLVPAVAEARVPVTYNGNLRTVYFRSTRPGQPEAYRLMITGRGHFVIRDEITGDLSKEFDPADVDHVTFTGDDDEDMITNDTSIRMMAWGRGGDDVLIGGPGVDILAGQDGVDWLYGNEGDDWLVPGEDVKEGTCDGGPGVDLIEITDFNTWYGAHFYQGFVVPVPLDRDDDFYFQTIYIP